MEIWIGLLAVFIGICVSVIGYYCLISFLPKKAKERDTSISMTALTTSFWLVIGGIIIIVLGFLYLMGIIPPPGW
jgi:heme/copper-type cytochrome/quinol oxidase subunit 2